MKTDDYYDKPKGCERNFLVIVIAIMLLISFACSISCTKETVENDQQCWLCIDKYGVKELARFETCDVLVATEQDGKRWKDEWGVWHLITCTEIK